MKKSLSVLLAGLILGATVQAQAAFWTGGVYNNDLGTKVNNIRGLDWSSSGSGDGIALGPFGNVNALTPGTNFDFLYQAKLVGVTDPGGQPVAFPGLDTPKFEYTVVASIHETVADLQQVEFDALHAGPELVTATFLTTGGTFFIYNDATPNSNVGTGFGFDDGIIAAKGDINAGQVTVFTANLLTGEGIGSTTLYGPTTSVNNAYFDPASIIFEFRFEGQLNYPPLDSATTHFFTGRTGEGNYADYTVARDDLLLKVDGSSKFISAVPEPSTVILLGAGLLGLAGFSRKRARKA